MVKRPRKNFLHAKRFVSIPVSGGSHATALFRTALACRCAFLTVAHLVLTAFVTTG